MKTLHLSIIVGVGIASVITMGLFLTFSSLSTGTVLQSNRMSSNSNYSNDMQNAVDVNSVIRRTIEPEKVCFMADGDFLVQYPTISKVIPESDKYVLQNETVHVEPLAKYYNGEGAELSKDQIVTLLSKYDFNHTTTYDEDAKHTFKFRGEYFTCGFQYGNNNYDLLIQYSKLVGTGTDFGYVPIVINNKTTGHASFTVFGVFNSTIVFNNTLDSKVTFKITPNFTSQNITVPAHELALLYLRGNITNPGNVTYHYQANELPGISGDIMLKLVPRCLDQNTMKSLYYQTGFALKFPTYLPDGFVPVCNEVNLEFAAIERFANQTGIDENKTVGHFPYSISSKLHVNNGIIAVRAIIQYGKNSTDLAYQDYKNDISIAYGDSTFSRYGDGSIMTYVAPGGVSTVVFTTKDQSYTFTGKIPLEELIKMAKSLS